MNRQRLRGGAVLVVAAGVAGWATVALWAGNPVSLDSLLAMTVAGVSIGAIYAIAAAGLVVTYTTSGIFNFAQGAIGMFMAFVYWQLSQEIGLHPLLAVILVVGVIAPFFGLIIHRAMMRGLARADLVVQLMTTVALTVFLMGLASWIWDPAEARTIPYFFGSGGFQLGDTFVLWHRFLTIVLGVAIAFGLRILIVRTRTGLAMRAVVDDPTLAARHGARPERVSSLSWALSSSLAALAGILIAPEVLLNVEGLTLLIIDAFAAAIIGRLRNLPLTIAGGLLLGILNAFCLSFLELNGRWVNLTQALPTIVLFVALLALPSAPIVAGRRRARVHARVPQRWEVALGGVAIVVGLWWWTSGMSAANQSRLTVGVITAVILVSLVPLIGWSGQVALAPLAFAGIGAYTMVAHASQGDFWGLAVGALLAVPFGILMALPALRLQGLYFALASVAFARGMELLFLGQADVLGDRSERVERPVLFGIDFDDQRNYLILCAVVLAVILVALNALRRSRYGRRLIALRDSPAACTTVGLDVRTLKLRVFCLSAAIGAIGGCLLAMHRGTPTAPEFGMFPGITLTLFLVFSGVMLLVGAVFAGWTGFVVAWIGTTWPGAFTAALSRLAPGGLAAGMSRNPLGAAGAAAALLGPWLPWRGQQRKANRAAAERQRATDPMNLGLTTEFTPEALREVDDALGVPLELRGEVGSDVGAEAHPAARGNGSPPGRDESLAEVP